MPPLPSGEGVNRGASVSLTIAVKHRVLLTLFMLLLLAAFGLPFLSYANRLLSGKSLSLFSLLHGPALWLLLPLAAWRSSACCRRREGGRCWRRWPPAGC